jgi:hypothetical protein
MMPTCTRPGYLGDAPQTTVEVVCVRCHGTKWVPDPLIPLTADGRVAGPPIPLVRPYTCHRCRTVLAGRNAIDPLGKEPTEAQRVARQRFARARQGRPQSISFGKEPPPTA